MIGFCSYSCLAELVNRYTETPTLRLLRHALRHRWTVVSVVLTEVGKDLTAAGHPVLEKNALEAFMFKLAVGDGPQRLNARLPGLGEVLLTVWVIAGDCWTLIWHSTAFDRGAHAVIIEKPGGCGERTGHPVLHT